MLQKINGLLQGSVRPATDGLYRLCVPVCPLASSVHSMGPLNESAACSGDAQMLKIYRTLQAAMRLLGDKGHPVLYLPRKNGFCRERRLLEQNWLLLRHRGRLKGAEPWGVPLLNA